MGEAARVRYGTEGVLSAPLVLRAPYGGGVRGDGPPDALGGPGNHRRFAREIEHARHPFGHPSD